MLRAARLRRCRLPREEPRHRARWPASSNGSASTPNRKSECRRRHQLQVARPTTSKSARSKWRWPLRFSATAASGPRQGSPWRSTRHKKGGSCCPHLMTPLRRFRRKQPTQPHSPWQNLAAPTGNGRPRPNQIKETVTWYIGGTLPSWRGAPLSLALLLESDDLPAAERIGEAILGGSRHSLSTSRRQRACAGRSRGEGAARIAQLAHAEDVAMHS